MVCPQRAIFWTMRLASSLLAAATFVLACGGSTEEPPPAGTSTQALGPYGYEAKLAWCRASVACSAGDEEQAKVCAGAVDGAPVMTESQFDRCAELARALDCDAPLDTGAWVHVRIACGH